MVHRTHGRSISHAVTGWPNFHKKNTPRWPSPLSLSGRCRYSASLSSLPFTARLEIVEAFRRRQESLRWVSRPLTRRQDFQGPHKEIKLSKEPFQENRCDKNLPRAFRRRQDVYNKTGCSISFQIYEAFTMPYLQSRYNAFTTR